MPDIVADTSIQKKVSLKTTNGIRSRPAIPVAHCPSDSRSVVMGCGILSSHLRLNSNPEVGGCFYHVRQRQFACEAVQICASPAFLLSEGHSAFPDQRMALFRSRFQ